MDSNPSRFGVFHSGLYAPSQFNIMNIMAHIYERPNKQVDLGPVDDKCGIILCDLKQPDEPIVYASPAFLKATGYDLGDVLGLNCRFLQAPGGNVLPKSPRKYVDKDTVKKIRKAVDKNQELQIEVVNFKKSGKKFINCLTIIPISWGCDGEFNYSVGFMVAKKPAKD
ncbi:PAS domain-containing protein [Podospora appendiculata]|uniref:PAS domain-containing protein n=1 Tax=Podospora appendiculata TaxID=314037 RepID=A0AAE0X1N3_9PEZI|nr:PAS domain-containing protein [Podospora appendiculata]